MKPRTSLKSIVRETRLPRAPSRMDCTVDAETNFASSKRSNRPFTIVFTVLPRSASSSLPFTSTTLSNLPAVTSAQTAPIVFTGRITAARMNWVSTRARPVTSAMKNAPATSRAFRGRASSSVRSVLTWMTPRTVWSDPWQAWQGGLFRSGV